MKGPVTGSQPPPTTKEFYEMGASLPHCKRYILAGSHDQFRDFCLRHRIRRSNAHYVSGWGFLRGRHGLTIELVGSYWTNTIFHNYGAFFRDVEAAGCHLKTTPWDPPEPKPEENPLTKQFGFFGRGPRGSVPLRAWDHSKIRAPRPLALGHALVVAQKEEDEQKFRNRSARPFVVRYTWWRRLLYRIKAILIAGSILLAAALTAWRLW